MSLTRNIIIPAKGASKNQRKPSVKNIPPTGLLPFNNPTPEIKPLERKRGEREEREERERGRGREREREGERGGVN